MTQDSVQGRFWSTRARDWAEVQEGQVAAGYDAVLAAFGAVRGLRLLDVGCGSGGFAVLARQGGATVFGLDAAAGLLDIAAERVPDGTFHRGDMARLPMAEGTFDLVTGFNAFQFAFDPVQALTEARRVLVPGGRIAVLSWAEPQEMPAARVLTALRDLLPPPPPGPPGPFALSEPAALRRAAEAAGLQVLEMTEVETAFRYPDLATALRGWNSSGVAARTVEHAGDAAVTAAHQAALTPFLRADGEIHLPARFRILIGRR